MKLTANFDDKDFLKKMNGIMEYSSGFLAGVGSGKRAFLDNLGQSTIGALKEFVDSMARVDPASLHHVYEWSMTGSPEARLFDIEYTVSNLGLSLKSTFRQSSSVKSGSTTPFYNKAKIMEEGTPVTIRPRKSDMLVFTNSDGEQVFTKNPVRVDNPGGNYVEGSYERTFDQFISNYFSQSFLNASGILDKLKDLSVYKRNLSSGSKMGFSRGREIGYRWIANAGVIR